MKVQKTLQFKIIQPNRQKARSINTTMRQYRKCVNFYLHEIAKGTILTDIYNKAKQQYNLQTGLIQTARDVAKEQYNSYKNNPDNHHFPHFKGLMTVRYDHRSISFKESDGHFGMWANITTVNGKVKVPITSCPEYIEKLKNDRFKSVQLKYRKGSFYLNVIFEDNKKIPAEKDFEHFISIDRGSHNNIAVAIVQNRKGDILESKFFSANKMLEKRRQYAKLRQQLGKKKIWSMIKNTKVKERNYMKDTNHKISTSIVQMSSKYSNSVVVLENLKGIRKTINWSKNNNKKGHSWAFLELEEMLVYKAHRNSIAVRRVYPRGTSSTCKNCFGKIKRSPSIKAVCKTCKKEYNADWLGAVNITRRLFSYMLKNLGHSESGPKQGRNESKGSVIAPRPSWSNSRVGSTPADYLSLKPPFSNGGSSRFTQ